LPSTNLTAKGMALDGGEHGTVILAESQTHGKGRYNRGFCSPPGGIYMSVILRSEHVPFSALTLVTAFTAVSVCEAIEAVTDKRPQIKWVNDIFWGGKKICGISTEAVSDFESGQTPWLVVGIGINYHTPEAAFPPELRSVVGSLYEGEPPPSPRNRLAAEIINRMVTPDRQGEAQMLTAYKQRMFMLGKKVTVTTPTQVYTATAADLDPMGQLVVIKEDGQTVVLCAGEISVSSTL
jgi:BirA family biotin operon repressor/biotin-[acetyl-CoA-carboxylase] ligase